ncbi:MAG: tyrosine-protein phosphatase [Actinomycetota bacterium]
MTDRRIVLEGCHNCRDLGGYETADGRRVRWGELYRSSDLYALTDDDVSRIDELGIATVFDLRSPEEAIARPSRLPAGPAIEQRHAPSTRARPFETLEDMIVADTLPTPDTNEVTAVYVGQLQSGLVDEFRRMVELAADATARPLLFHCAAGKDRTGLGAGLLLGALGVPRATIVADYDLTTQYLMPPRMRELRPLLDEHGVADDVVAPFLMARTEVFERTLDVVEQRWGGFPEYAIAHLGVTPALIASLREQLLEPA